MNNIKNLRNLKGYTLEQVAEKIGTTRQTVYKYENGIIANIPKNKIEALAKVFDVTPDVVCGWTITPMQPSSFLPIKDEQQTLPSIYSADNHFALRIKDSAMAKSGLPQGAVITAERTDKVKPGDIAVIEYDGAEYVRRLSKADSTLVFSADDAKAIKISAEDFLCGRVKILGRVKQVVVNFDADI